MVEGRRVEPERRSHLARFEGGPRDGTVVPVLALESGQPPEILLTPGQPGWVYVLGGAPRRDGSLPYVHMSPTKASLIRSHGRRLSGDAAGTSG